MIDIAEKPETQKTAAALGLFDGLHIGHRAVIEKTLGRAGLASAVFTFSDGAALPKLGGQHKLLLTEQRKRIILGEMGIEYICAPGFSEVRGLSPEKFVQNVIINKLNAAYVVCGYDFRFGKDGSGNAEILRALCEKNGIECEIVPAVTLGVRPVGSSDIRAAVESGDITAANRMLGSELSYTLPVITGRQLGRTIGFPTANQKIPDEVICPAHGVYASFADIDGKRYFAITDIGVKPTVKDDDDVLMETFVIDFSGDLYGRELTVSLRYFLRGEKKFSGLPALSEQLRYDTNRSVKGI